MPFDRQPRRWLGPATPRGACPHHPSSACCMLHPAPGLRPPRQVHTLGPAPRPRMCSLPVPREPLRRVAVTGGVHGNEMSGVCLVQHWLRAPGELQRPSFAACRRDIDRDLNRTFTSTFPK